MKEKDALRLDVASPLEQVLMEYLGQHGSGSLDHLSPEEFFELANWTELVGRVSRLMPFLPTALVLLFRKRARQCDKLVYHLIRCAACRDTYLKLKSLRNLAPFALRGRNRRGR